MNKELLKKAKDYLMQVEILSEKIEQEKEQLQYLEENAGGVKGMDYSSERVQTSPRADNIESNVVSRMMLPDRIERDQERRDSLMYKLTDDINRLSNKKQVEVLHRRYVKLEGIGEIAKKMELSDDWVKHIHSSAIKSFANVHRKKLEKQHLNNT